ncbi:MAG: hypothetical protein ABW168_13035 [Sedimenticola sp.]
MAAAPPDWVLITLAALCFTGTSQAANTVKIGMATTLSTKAGYLGQAPRIVL